MLARLSDAQFNNMINSLESAVEDAHRIGFDKVLGEALAASIAAAEVEAERAVGT